jgi:hypothetical protein
VHIAGARTAPPHHQTLEALFDWSYDLLTDTEKLALLGWVTVSGYDADLLACFYPGTWPTFFFRRRSHLALFL